MRMNKVTALGMLLLAAWTSSVTACHPRWDGPAKQLPAGGPPGSLTTPSGQTIFLDYNERPGNTFCNKAGPTVAVHASVWLFKADTCTLCPTQAICKIWAPGADGNYQPDCSATIKGSRWDMHTNIPGDESSQGWGPDPFSHWHYQCCCGTKCVTNKLYVKKEDFPDSLGPPDISNWLKRVGPRKYKYRFIINDN